MTAAAIAKAGSTDPLKVALALEGLMIVDSAGHQVTMRKDDHQVLMTYYSAVFTKDVKYDSERTGLGWKTESTIKPSELDQSHTCKMKRPTT